MCATAVKIRHMRFEQQLKKTTTNTVQINRNQPTNKQNETKKKDEETRQECDNGYCLPMHTMSKF